MKFDQIMEINWRKKIFLDGADPLSRDYTCLRLLETRYLAGNVFSE